MIRKRINYLRRVFAAYLGKGASQLTFWHGTPRVNTETDFKVPGQYYMPFIYKADYPGPFDKNCIPLLDYRGEVGRQYNPIAIAQYGLGHYNIYKKTKAKENFDIAKKQADWLVNHLEKNRKGVDMWMHHFDWEYRDVLKAPWYSALAQGQGISLLVRLYEETKEEKYLRSADKAFISFEREVNDGGVIYTDRQGNIWPEETIVDPPTHILNGFMWALWGIYDYYLVSRKENAKIIFNKAIKTLEDNLNKYDTGYWSLYEQSGTKLKMLASPFYHSLHVIQLKIMYELTGKDLFRDCAKRWEAYQENWYKRKKAFIYKAIFKILYY